MYCYAMEPEHSKSPRVLARERKRRQRANASAESTPACQSGNETTSAARARTVQLDDLREVFYCAFCVILVYAAIMTASAKILYMLA